MSKEDITLKAATVTAFLLSESYGTIVEPFIRRFKEINRINMYFN